MRALYAAYGDAYRAYGGKGDDGRDVPVLDGIMMVLMDRNQPYGEAMKVPASLVLELIQSRLDESLSSLEGEKSRLARKQATATLEFGSVTQMTEAVRELVKDETDLPEGATL